MLSRVMTLVALSAILAGSANAAVTYELVLRVPGRAEAANSVLQVTPSEQILGVEALLRETVTDGTVSNFAASNVIGFNATVSASNGGMFENKATDSSGGFLDGDDDSDTFSYSALTFAGQPGRDARDAGGGVQELVFGTIDLTAPAIGQSVFSLSDSFESIGGNFTLADGTVLDAPGGAFSVLSGSLTVSAVPEPSCFALIGVAAAGVLTRRRRR